MTSPATASSPSPAPAEPVDYPARAAGILRRFGRTEAADYLDERRASGAAQATVVVIGEVKRGKSSLINALVGRPYLLPVDVDANTSVPIQVVRDTSIDDDAVRLDFGSYDTSISLDELPEWATTTGTYVADTQSTDGLPSAATVTISHGIDVRAVVIDTPGVGGLDPQAVELALSTAQGAGVLVLVADATTPITEPELAILKRAVDSVGSVVVAVAKIDKSLTRWRAIVANNRELIAHHLGRSVPVIGVSSLRALAALDETAERRHNIEISSGIAELRAIITQRAAQSDIALEHLAIRRSIGELRVVLRGIQWQLRAVNEPGEAIAELQQRQDEFKKLQVKAQEWETYLQRDLTVDKQQILSEFDANLERVKDNWQQYINKSGMKILRTKSQVFTAQIQVSINGVIQRALALMSQRLAERCTQLFGSPTVWDQIAVHAVATMRTEWVFRRDVGKKTTNIIDPSVLTLGVIGGSSLGAGASAMLATIGIAGGGWVIGLPVGGGWIAINLAHRALRNGKQNLITWLRESASSARVATNREIDNLLNVSRTEMIVRYRAWVRAELDRAGELKAEAQRAVQADKATRAKDVERHAKNARIVEAVIAGLEAELGRSPQGDAC